ncbi:hypothetical protein NBRC10512_007786 [Rhodotorula toruloides]|uniref:RHTO0S01e17326g1_1 n=2 Tax=Rhodotorula toruloides TaxID=5286 RepID=A0A061AF80_RHOTO|nr:TPR repeat containing protein [Rhodotorula toruloides NP11]EMS19666.1 TPR repeat containing protein [Rhodotorula toruloides NP11]KAJ8293985.1 hypothetical protein OF846_003229 [Rhodotorula toruloides]CDR36241.1 RHTO0S01e17326g1_1 [Rhodotorula toruloides]
MLRQLARTAGKAAQRPLARSLATQALSRPALRSPRTPSSPSVLMRQASSTTPHSSTVDPQESAAQQALDEGTEALSRGDLETAKKAYERSVGIKQTSVGYYNLGVVQYQLRDLASAITSFEASIEHTPSSVKPTFPDPDAPTPELTPAQAILADTHTNLGAAYILTSPPRPEKALEHLQKALMMNPDDGEVCYNLAAVLEATGELDEALIAYERSLKLGIARAEINVRNISAKIIGKRREEEEKAKQTGGSVASQDVSPSS